MIGELLLGHLVGDYLFQTDFMALNKTKNTLKGWIAAIIHCIFYTFAVCLMMNNYDMLWIIIVFFSHFFIDKFNLGEIYMDKIKGHGLKKFINENNWINNLKYSPNPINDISRETIIKGGFTTFVYAVTDNTMHLVLMFLGYKLLY